ncbi:peptidoglycan recognition protein family protein [Actinomadura rudentiformis]|uniref:N-acetylmuramoyl-L-alanine amidase n=1 Tax=Actinomadura rudentiformis TaxID=359158 RepID=A0A6H9YUY5_9ACTN|nr:peptidoglycan recognition family protein [Actinomadura rudentiformis]KAB2352427.1 N-acetylmuramoyl-L-alanine amidase [Actinomadura rudentiformis]
MPQAPRLHRRGLLLGTAAMTGGVVLGALPFASREAQAAPRVYTRADWKARPPKAVATVLPQGPDHIVVHHTASQNSTDYSLEHAFGLSRAIQNFHMDDNGWDDTGQQLTISRGGFLMEGRNRSLEAIAARQHVRGAQTLGHNDHTIGIENEGTYLTERPTKRLWWKLAYTCAWLCDTYDLDPYEAIVGHRDYVATACPGDELYAMLPALRATVATIMDITSPRRELHPPRRGPFPTPRTRFDHGPAASPGER